MKAHRGASQAELRESLRAATSVVSARLNTQDSGIQCSKPYIPSPIPYAINPELPGPLYSLAVRRNALCFLSQDPMLGEDWDATAKGKVVGEVVVVVVVVVLVLGGGVVDDEMLSAALVQVINVVRLKK